MKGKKEKETVQNYIKNRIYIYILSVMIDGHDWIENREGCTRKMH